MIGWVLIFGTFGTGTLGGQAFGSGNGECMGPVAFPDTEIVAEAIKGPNGRDLNTVFGSILGMQEVGGNVQGQLRGSDGSVSGGFGLGAIHPGAPGGCPSKVGRNYGYVEVSGVTGVENNGGWTNGNTVFGSIAGMQKIGGNVQGQIFGGNGLVSGDSTGGAFYSKLLGGNLGGNVHESAGTRGDFGVIWTNAVRNNGEWAGGNGIDDLSKVG
jgi:hypothetical protein